MVNIIQPPHPFYPLEANIIGYLANEWSVIALLGTFAAACIVVVWTTIVLLRQSSAQLPGKEKATISWFVLSMRAINLVPAK